MSNNGGDNRRSFRVTETVYIKYEVISDREFHEGLDRRKLRSGVSDGFTVHYPRPRCALGGKALRFKIRVEPGRRVPRDSER